MYINILFLVDVWLLSWKECNVCYVERRTSEDKNFYLTYFFGVDQKANIINEKKLPSKSDFYCLAVSYEGQFQGEKVTVMR